MEFIETIDNNGRNYRVSLVNIFSVGRSSQESRGFSHERFNKKSFEVKDYEELANKSPQKLYDSPKVKSEYNRCHIIPRQAGGSNDPSNLFLLCEECHEESPDTLNPKNFFKWVYKKRKNESRPFGRDVKRFTIKFFEDCIEKGKNPFTCKPEKAKGYTHGARVSESTLVMALADTCDSI